MPAYLTSIPNVSAPVTCEFPKVPAPDGLSCVCGFGTTPLGDGCVAPDVTGPVATPIPSLSEWAVLATVALLAVAGWWRAR